MTPEQYFKEHGASRIEDLKHEDLILFALTFMDFFTQYSVQSLLSGAFGEPVDPCPKETDAGIIEAYNTGRSFCATYTEAEGVKETDETDLGTPGYQITIEDRSDILKHLDALNEEFPARSQAKPFRSPEGYLYPSYQDYCNDPDLDSDLIQCKLASGQRTPQNDYERALLKEIKEAQAQGKVLEIYPE